MRVLWTRDAMTLAKRKSDSEIGPLYFSELPIIHLFITHQRRRGNVREVIQIGPKKKDSPRLSTTLRDTDRRKLKQLRRIRTRARNPAGIGQGRPL